MTDYTLYQGDCLEVMPTLEKGSVAMVFADLPYQATRCAWDKRFDEAFFWRSMISCLSQNCLIACTCDVRLAGNLIDSCPVPFRYDLIYSKSIATGNMNANRMPLRSHEIVLIFYKKGALYTAQKTSSPSPNRIGVEKNQPKNVCYGRIARSPYNRAGSRHPKSVLHLGQKNDDRGQHPTQKPVALLEWLVSSYTARGDTVLDPCFGSNTTGVACARLGRRYIGIERDAQYFAAGKARLEAEHARLAEQPAQGALGI